MNASNSPNSDEIAPGQGSATQAMREHPQDWTQLIGKAELVLQRLQDWLEPLAPVVDGVDWAEVWACRYRRRSGAWGSRGNLQPVLAPQLIAYADLMGVQTQRQRFADNLTQFVAGQGANNVLLTGARGTGKSSLVKAGLKAHAAQGLRLIEVDKSDLLDLPELVEDLRRRPYRFMVFCDDLSFESGEPGYPALKSVLDGSVATQGDNVLLVATSNRRHLLPEYHADNLQQRGDDGELHPGEAVEEKVSLSERFGLWISFYPFNQDEYLEIVRHWLAQQGLDDAAIEAARGPALVWALERGSRSGRVAQQFARGHAGRLGLLAAAAGGQASGSQP